MNKKNIGPIKCKFMVETWIREPSVNFFYKYHPLGIFIHVVVREKIAFKDPSSSSENQLFSFCSLG
jgi:hypothetical protein